MVFETINGDLNQDGIEDCVLIIKGTDKSQFVNELDRNRRGIIVLFNKNDDYKLAVQNNNCFSSENEDGGVYFATELFIEIMEGKLYVHYGHGRYGYWNYTFRFQHSDFSLIGYDAGSRSDFISDYVTFDERSINFLTNKELMREVTHINADGKVGYQETWNDVAKNELIKLSEIEGFDELRITTTLNGNNSP